MRSDFLFGVHCIVVDDLPVVWMLGRRGRELPRNPSGEFPARLLDVVLTLFELVLKSLRWRRRTGVSETRTWRGVLSEDFEDLEVLSED